MMAVTSACKDGSKIAMDNGKYVRYTPEQVEALERLYHECPKPTSLRRQQLIRECPILSHIEPKQIKVWFQNRRCREKQRKEAGRLQAVNRKLTAMYKLLMEENDRLQKQVSHLVYENSVFRQHTPNGAIATTDTSCESVVTSGQQHPPRDASPAGLLSIAEETLAEFLSKATGTAVEWVQMPGMKYPKEPPSVAIVDCKGLDQHRQKHLLNHIQTKANELSPGLMLVALCEEAVEKLSDMNHPDGDCPLCLFPLVTKEHQSETLPFMKLMSCFHCFHSECIIRWWNWLESSKQTGSSKSDNATARRNRAVVLAGGGHSANGAVAQGSQSEGDSNNTTIFVGGLDSEISDEDLRQPFLQYGDVVSVKIPIGKGCGFVQLADRKNAEEAIQGLNGTVIGKQTVRLSWGRSPGNKHWRNNDSNGNHYGGQGYGGHGYGGHGYAARQNQDIAMQQPAAAIQGAS
ncbi:Homeobox-leucine zipper protein ATHB-15 [Lathyrus oleraceus]|uniref:Homeobox-leucine zipper protein ATHB-15 n=2 Tax=Pisum sativum TaxID=3888 RepID=A0A9D4WNB0_PEA|nr:Homeobox-leucine zipper protein ATHB-15 [Pisum sativum]